MYKARSITNKASSACRMNMNLIEGDREVQQQMSKKVGFNEAAGAAGEALGGQAPKKEEGGQSSGAIEVGEDKTPASTEDTAPAPTTMRRSPAKLAPLAAIAVKAAPAIIGALGKGKEKKSGGGAQETKVVVNNSANANSTSNSQASNAIDPK
jgi:hypothetical protein